MGTTSQRSVKKRVTRMPIGAKRGDLKPFCQTCRVNRVKHWYNRFCCYDCVPRSVRQEGCRKGRRNFAYRRRAQMFRADLARIDRNVTREELIDLFWLIYKRAYNAGFQVGQDGGRLEDAVERGAA